MWDLSLSEIWSFNFRLRQAFPAMKRFYGENCFIAKLNNYIFSPFFPGYLIFKFFISPPVIFRFFTLDFFVE
jgi:hypothetical protein